MSTYQAAAFVISIILVALGLVWVVRREVVLQRDHRTTSITRLCIEVGIPIIGAAVLLAFVGGFL
ncbi:hypothetical protein BMS3Bbin02_00194 [bacterium BMS3Bbin02]|nr:hypothetical protein BMS3Bbin02_00194 [bacterium BMS3Bbin02]